MVDEGCEGDVDHAKNLLRFAYRGRASQFWMDESFLGCPSRLLSSFGCKIRELGRADNDSSQADVFTERRGRAQGVQCFQPRGSSRCTSLFFLFMIRRPPRSPLFPYHDALPILVARR